jgi:excisionase family DNA binding protein
MSAPTLADPAALTVKQAAAYLGVSTRTLYRITAECGTGKDELPVVHIRGRRLFLRRDLDTYLARHTT